MVTGTIRGKCASRRQNIVADVIYGPLHPASSFVTANIVYPEISISNKYLMYIITGKTGTVWDGEGRGVRMTLEEGRREEKASLWWT